MILIGALTFLVMFLLLAFFGGSEMAFLSCNKLKLKHLMDSGYKPAAIIGQFQRDPKKLLTTILIGINLSHVTLTAIFSYGMETVGVHEEWMVVLILAPFLIIFGEIVPKDWFRLKADDYIYRFAGTLQWFSKFLFPISAGIGALTELLVALTLPKVKRSPFVTKDEFRYMIDESTKKGVLHEHEKRLIHTILNLGNITVEEVMTPLKEFPALELMKSMKDAREVARNSKMPALLVFEEIPSIVVGIVYVFDLLFEENLGAGLSNYLRPPLFIPQETSVEKAILLLQLKRMSYAAVTNASREVVGVVGVENLVRF